MVVSEAPAIRGPQGSALVARLSAAGAHVDVFVGVGSPSLRCAGCSRDLTWGEGCFTVRHFGTGGGDFPVCTRCEPLPAAAVVEWEHHLYRECTHSRCPYPRLVSRLRRSGVALGQARLGWEHERPLADWGPRAAVHRPRPGRLIEP
jgi:hypothetical protein